MSEDHTYNGWSNYETWAAALWIDNDQGTYTYSRELVQRALEDSGDAQGSAVGRSAVGLAADMLKEWMEDDMPELEASLWSDLLRAAFSEIDWHEIARHYVDEIREES